MFTVLLRSWNFSTLVQISSPRMLRKKYWLNRFKVCVYVLSWQGRRNYDRQILSVMGKWLDFAADWLPGPQSQLWLFPSWMSLARLLSLCGPPAPLLRWRYRHAYLLGSLWGAGELTYATCLTCGKSCINAFNFYIWRRLILRLL